MFTTTFISLMVIAFVYASSLIGIIVLLSGTLDDVDKKWYSVILLAVNIIVLTIYSLYIFNC